MYVFIDVYICTCTSRVFNFYQILHFKQSFKIKITQMGVVHIESIL